MLHICRCAERGAFYAFARIGRQAGRPVAAFGQRLAEKHRGGTGSDMRPADLSAPDLSDARYAPDI